MLLMTQPPIWLCWVLMILDLVLAFIMAVIYYKYKAICDHFIVADLWVTEGRDGGHLVK